MIILSSFGLRSPIVAAKTKVYLPDCEDMKVLVVPFAGFNELNTARREIDEGLIPFGFNPNNIHVCHANMNEHKTQRYDLIYVPGGNPFKLLSACQENDIISFLKQLVNQGAIYFGASAGADLATENLEYLRLVEDCDYQLTSFTGLSLLKGTKIICHTDQRDFGTLQAIKDCDERKTLFVRNDDVYMIE